MMDSSSISIVKIQGVLLVTMPAEPEDSVIFALQEKVLNLFGLGKYYGVVLDISAVETVDSYFARTIAETARMVSLMGGRTAVVGMRPSVAITTTQLGLTLGTAFTALDLERALNMLKKDEHHHKAAAQQGGKP